MLYKFIVETSAHLPNVVSMICAGDLLARDVAIIMLRRRSGPMRITVVAGFRVVCEESADWVGVA